ncbi:hypothetical protein BGZ90_004107 [Linnemannia elongata]|nr:hypothetical protein BGZ90_004107 [Linnemannia elongata]
MLVPTERLLSQNWRKSFALLILQASSLRKDGYSHAQIPELTRKVAFVTGFNPSIGFVITVAMREQRRRSSPSAPARVLGAGYDRETHQAAQGLLKEGLPLHILVSNSDIAGGPLELKAGGMEGAFSVNHMRINYDTIYKTGDTSQSHHAQGLIQPLKTRQHHVRKGPHPSIVVYPVERGSLTPLYLGTCPEVENKKMTERCIGPIANETEPYRNYARDEEVQEELWAYSEKLANDKPNA